MSAITGKDLVTVASIVTAGLVTTTVVIVTHADGTVLGAFLAFLGGLGLGRSAR